jgi:hypothetical protein
MNPYDQTLQNVASENPYDATVRNAYHGTPHRFAPTANNPLGEFDLSKMGSGEGAQAYGWGTYVAENPNIARGYRTSTTGKTHGIDNLPIKRKWQKDLVDDVERHMTRENISDPIVAIKSYAGNLDKTINAFPDLTRHNNATEAKKQWLLSHQNSATYKKPGHFYHVEIPERHIRKMLDWDQEMQEQPEIARILGIPIRDVAKEMTDWDELRSKFRTDDEFWESPERAKLEEDAYKIIDHPERKKTGAEIYKDLVSRFEHDDDAWNELGMTPHDVGNIQEAASRYLHKKGISGIKFLDARSRDKNEGTRNFVLFDPSIAKIVERE